MGLCDIFGKTIATGDGSDYYNVIYPGYTNLFNGEREQGWYPNGGTFNPAVGAARTTDYIELPSNAKYVYSQIFQGVTYNPEKVVKSALAYIDMVFFDENKTYMCHPENDGAGGAVGVEGNYIPIEIPSGAKYVRVSFGGAYMDGEAEYFIGVAEDNTAALLPWEDYYEPGEIKSAYIKHQNLTYRDKPLTEGKTWVLFGDSITDAYAGKDWQGDGFASKIAREFGLTIDNRGKSGSNICSGTTDYPEVNGIIMLNAFLAEIEAGTTAQPDYITIAFGANCWEEYVGTADDTSANTDKSYYGATKYFIEKLREKCPNSVFGFVLYCDVDWLGVKDTKHYGAPKAREAMKAVCEEYGVPYINMKMDAGLTVDMLPDGVHISSDQAANLYYHAMRRFMMGL